MRSSKTDIGSKRAAETCARAASPRICMPTWRNFTQKAYRCGLYEAQDVLVEIDDVDLIYLDMAWATWFNERWLRTPLYHDVSRRLIFANPGLKKVRLQRDYDVFIAVCDTYWDLPYINAIEGWRDRCKVSICWIVELWASQVADFKYWHGALKQFDYIFLEYKGSTDALSQAIGRMTYWLPGAVDAFRFSSCCDTRARVVDVYSIGRRYENIHREILKATERGELFYLHDTIANIANNDVQDWRQHRDVLANIAKRSRFFLVAPGKMDASEETRGQVEIGHRYYEGAAAGTVMLGDVPDCEAYRELFDWPQAVIQIQPDGSDVISVLKELNSEPERMAAISRRNTREALLRHDWAYRWNEMFRVAGVEPSPGMAVRERSLRGLADIAARQ
jgi:hypothetical protein